MLIIRSAVAFIVALFALLAFVSSFTEARPQLPSMLQTLHMTGFDPYAAGNVQYEFFGRR